MSGKQRKQITSTVASQYELQSLLMLAGEMQATDEASDGSLTDVFIRGIEMIQNASSVISRDVTPSYTETLDRDAIMASNSADLLGAHAWTNLLQAAALERTMRKSIVPDSDKLAKIVKPIIGAGDTQDAELSYDHVVNEFVSLIRSIKTDWGYSSWRPIGTNDISTKIDWDEFNGDDAYSVVFAIEDLNMNDPTICMEWPPSKSPNMILKDYRSTKLAVFEIGRIVTPESYDACVVLTVPYDTTRNIDAYSRILTTPSLSKKLRSFMNRHRFGAVSRGSEWVSKIKNLYRNGVKDEIDLFMKIRNIYKPLVEKRGGVSEYYEASQVVRRAKKLVNRIYSAITSMSVPLDNIVLFGDPLYGYILASKLDPVSNITVITDEKLNQDHIAALDKIAKPTRLSITTDIPTSCDVFISLDSFHRMETLPSELIATAKCAVIKERVIADQDGSDWLDFMLAMDEVIVKMKSPEFLARTKLYYRRRNEIEDLLSLYFQTVKLSEPSERSIEFYVNGIGVGKE